MNLIIGVMTFEAIKAANVLTKEGLDVKVVKMSTIKPIDEETITKCCSQKIYMKQADTDLVVLAVLKICFKNLN